MIVRLLATTIAFGSVLTADATKVFVEVVKPALERDCFGCHGQGQTLAGLDLRSREAIVKGGQRGPALQPGNATGSLLIKALEGSASGLMMPPGGASKRLPPATIAAFREWVNGGAPWPDALDKKAWTYTEADIWAFRPVKKVSPPKVKGFQNPIDAFVLAKLADRGLRPAAAADRVTLIRRVTFDLTGLPPTPAEVDAFVKDSSADAWKKVVDRLLASPRYGERWARHWLDVVRYADSSGYSNDFERPNAWRYRDYVIRAFNNDKPYDQFIREQIAGDEMDASNGEYRIATGFLRAGPWEHTGMSVEAVTRQMWLDDVTGAVGTTFLGLTVGCARCHDHKFDPIPTKDYYRLQAVFASTEFARPPVAFLPSENPDQPAAKARLQQSIAETQARMDRVRTLVRSRLAARKGLSSPDAVSASEMQKAMQELHDLTPEEFEEYKLHQKHLQLYKESLDRFEPKAFAVSSGPMDGLTDGGGNLKYPKAADYKPADVRILAGGNLQAAGESVQPGVLTAIEHYSSLPSPSIPATTAGRRLALAQWIASKDNPLTARVMVNRIWQSHFGTGLVPEGNNFGKMGRKPANPDLLDWLARYFMESGWSVKAVHRAILLSDTYQRSSRHPDHKHVLEKDPANSLLAFFPPRRVDAETLRDSLLFAAGELSPEAGGPGAFPEMNEDVERQPRHAMGSLQPAYFPSTEKRMRHRRSIYMFQQRGLLDPFIEVFNGPNPDLSCERREASTVPTQAFALMNSRFAHDRALAMAARISKQGGDKAKQIQRAFLLAYSRRPDDSELQSALAHWDKMTAHHAKFPAPEPEPKKPIVHTITSELTGEQFQFIQQDASNGYEANLQPRDVSAEVRGLADVALALLNSNEFLYIY